VLGAIDGGGIDVCGAEAAQRMLLNMARGDSRDNVYVLCA